MSTLAKKEIMKILRHKRKLINFSWKISALTIKAPNKNIKELLRRADSACYEDAEKLTLSCPLKEQI